MTFQDNNGNILEAIGDFAMSKQSVSFLNFEIGGDVSLNFNVDNNSINRKALNYYGPQMINQVAFTKQKFNRIKNGNIIDSGYIVIQSEEADFLNCFYVSGNSNWVQLLEGLITNLDFTGTINNIDYRVNWQKGITSSFTSIANATSGITFPFIDWCFNFKKGNTTYYSTKYIYEQLVDSDRDYLNKPLVDFYPCFFIHSLIEEIVKQNGLKLSGNLINDPIYKSLIITPSTGDFKLPINNIHNVLLKGYAQTFGAGIGIDQLYTNFEIASNPDSLWDISGKFTADSSTTYSIVMKADLSGFTSLTIYKNSISFLTMSGIFIHRRIIDITLNKGDIIQFYVKNTTVSPFTVTLDSITIQDINSHYNYVSPSDFLPSLKCSDIIKFIISYLGCSISFEEFSKTLSINIIDNIKLENSYNWSDYHLNHRTEYTVEQAKNNYFSFSSSNNNVITSYNNNHKISFGGGNITTNNTLLTEHDYDIFKFSPAKSGLGLNNIFSTNVPLISLNDDGDPIEFDSVSDNGGTVNSNFVLTLGSSAPIIAKHEIVRITNFDNSNLGYYIVQYDSNHTIPSGTVNIYFQFTTTFKGFIYKQKITFNKINPVILSVYPNMSSNLISASSILYVRQEPGSSGETSDNHGTAIKWDNVPFASFAKQQSNLPIDTWKNNLSIDNPDDDTYLDPTIKQLYFNHISKFLQNGNIRCQMLLPESVFKSFDFSNFIYLNTEKLTGYFFVKSIVNYQNSYTPVEVNLYML